MLHDELKPQRARLAIVMAGGVNPIYAEPFRSVGKMDVVGVVDPNRTAATAFIRDIGGPPVYDSLNLLCADRVCDCVLITSPLGIRDALTAVQAGLHVLFIHQCIAEWVDLLTLQREAMAHGLYVLTAGSLRNHSGFQSLADRIANGDMGVVGQVRCNISCAPPTSERRSESGWRAAFTSAASNSIDMCRWWMGGVEAVSADTGTLAGKPVGDYLANMILTHERGVSVHHITGARNGLLSERYRCETSLGILEIEMKGMIGDNDELSHKCSMRWKGRAEVLTALNGLTDSLAAPLPLGKVLARFAGCILGRETPPVEADNLAKVAEVIYAATMAAIDGTKIALPLVVRPREVNAISHRPR